MDAITLEQGINLAAYGVSCLSVGFLVGGYIGGKYSAIKRAFTKEIRGDSYLITEDRDGRKTVLSEDSKGSFRRLEDISSTNLKKVLEELAKEE